MGLWDRFTTAAASGTASAADDIRHRVVEQGWFGKDVTGNIAQGEAATPAITDNSINTNVWDQSVNTAIAVHEHVELYESVWGTEPGAADLYGTGPESSAAQEVAPADTATMEHEQDEGLEPGL